MNRRTGHISDDTGRAKEGFDALLVQVYCATLTIKSLSTTKRQLRKRRTGPLCGLTKTLSLLGFGILPEKGCTVE